MYVKICGITDTHTANVAVRAGADAIGLVSYAQSPRHIEPAAAREVIRSARDATADLGRQIDTVLVVRGVSITEAMRLMEEFGADVLQLHGGFDARDFEVAREAGLRVWRAASLADEPEVRAGAFGEERLLLDGSIPGSGEVWDVSTATRLSIGDEWLLAGGLSPENVQELLEASGAGGVDVSSGVESRRGVKDPDLVRAFVLNAKSARRI